MIDYLIIGSGLAGIAFAETAMENDKSILMVDDAIAGASHVSGGLYNPVVLKRFTPLANASEHLELLQTFYSRIEARLDCKINHRIPVLRRFSSIEEQNNWFIASDKPALSPFLATKLVSTKYQGIDSPFDFGRVEQTGYVNAPDLLSHYKIDLQSKGLLTNEVFDHAQIEMTPAGIQYKQIKAKHIIFAEGFKLHANPFFGQLPLDGVKGEILVIKAPQMDLDAIVNASVFILPLGDDLFKVGATYNWTDKTNQPTTEAKNELIDRLKEILTCDFEIVDHNAGVRPTVKDRKPLIGTHSEYPQLHILNGLGTRGVMLAPSMAKTLFEHIEYGIPIPKEIDFRRFDGK